MIIHRFKRVKSGPFDHEIDTFNIIYNSTAWP